nr:hypothetical protein CFP56_22217 [Quercus suber]
MGPCLPRNRHKLRASTQPSFPSHLPACDRTAPRCPDNSTRAYVQTLRNRRNERRWETPTGSGLIRKPGHERLGRELALGGCLHGFSGSRSGM